MSPKELAAFHRVTLSVMSHHVKTLAAVEVMELVDTRRAARGSVEHFYEPGPACSRPLVRDALGLRVDEAVA